MSNRPPSIRPIRASFVHAAILALAAAPLLLLAACHTTGPTRASLLPPREFWTITTNVTVKANEFSPTAAPIETCIDLDLSRPTMLAAAAVDWAPDGVPSSYMLQATTDPEESPWVTIATPANPSAGLRLVSFAPTLARYLRVRVPSSPAATPPVLRSLRPVAYSMRPTATWTLPPAAPVQISDTTALFDDDPGTLLAAPSASPGSTVLLDIDLHSYYPVGAVRMDWATLTNRPATLSLYFSRDGANWIKAGAIDSASTDEIDLVIATRSLPTRHIRLEATAPTPSAPDGEGQSSSSSANAAPPPAFILSSLQFSDVSVASRPWHLYEFAAKQMPAALAPWALLGRQPYWTVALAPGADAEPLMSTEGAFAPSATAPSLWPMAVVGTNAYTPAIARSASYSIPAPGVPLPAATWTFPNGLALTMRVLPLTPADATNDVARPLALASYEWANASDAALPVRLAWVLRPLRIPSQSAKGGLAFIARLRSSRPAPDAAPDLQEIRVNAEPLYAASAPGLRFLAAPFRDADISTSLLPEPAAEHVSTNQITDPNGLASAAWVLDTEIAPHSTNRVIIAATSPMFDSDRLLRRLSGADGGASATPPPPSGEGSTSVLRDLVRGSALPSLPALQRNRRPSIPSPDWPTSAADAVNTFDTRYADATFAAYVRGSAYAPTIHHPRPLQIQRLQMAYMLQLAASARMVPDPAERIRLDDDIWRFAALLRTGFDDQAADWLQLLIASQNPETGAVPALFEAFPLSTPDDAENADAAPVAAVPAADAEQAGYHSASAQLVFACMEYYRFTHDITFLRKAYPSMRAAMAYLQHLRETSRPPRPSRWRRLFGAPPPPPPSLGLFPAAPADPDRHPYSHAYWALLGWKELRAAASILGAADDYTWADSNYDTLRFFLKGSLDHYFAALPPGDAQLLPYSPEPGAPPSPYDAALLVWPVCEPDLIPDHVLLATLIRGYEPFLAATTPDRPLDRPSSTFTPSSAPAAAPLKRPLLLESVRLLLPLSLYGRSDYAREILFTLSDSLTPAPWGALPWSFPPGPFSMPSARSAALYALALRQVLIHEAPSTQVLHLLPGCPPDWLQLGDGLTIPSAPTAYGNLSLTAAIRRRHLRLTLSGDAFPPGGYRLWWPRQIRPSRVLLDSTELPADSYDSLGITLPPTFSGTLTAFYDTPFPSPRDF